MARNLTDLWDLIQTNGARVTIDIDQVRPDGKFDLEASHSNGSVRGKGSGELRRDSIGEEILFTITWGNNTQGAYQGRFDGGNFLNGSTFDVKNPTSHAGWRSDRAFPP